MKALCNVKVSLSWLFWDFDMVLWLIEVGLSAGSMKSQGFILEKTHLLEIKLS